MYVPHEKEAHPNFRTIEESLGIVFPHELSEFIRKIGAGYSKKGELLFFGDHDSSRCLLDWCNYLVGIGVYPQPKEGGPIFVAENCLGMQYGFRYDLGRCIYLMFDPNVFESYVICETGEEFANMLLYDEELVSLGGAVYPIIEKYGKPYKDFHFSPYVAPMLGGSLDPNNWSLAPARAHMATMFAEYASTFSPNKSHHSPH